MQLGPLSIKLLLSFCFVGLTLGCIGQPVCGQNLTTGVTKRSLPAPTPASSQAQQLIVRAKGLMKTMNCGQAVALLNKAIALEPRNAWAYHERAEAMRKSGIEVGDINLAKADYEAAIKLNPAFEEPYCSLAILYSESDNNDMAFKTIERMPKKTVMSFSVHNALAEIYAGADRYHDAISEFTWLIKAEPKRHDFLRKRGACYAALNKHLLAINDYSTLINANKYETGTMWLRASAYQHLGKWGEAAADYQRIINIEPNNDIGYKQHAESMLHLGRLRDAICDYTKVLTFAPDDIDTLTCRSEVYMKLGETLKGLKDLNAAISKEPDSARKAYLLRAHYYQAIGHFADAQSDLAKAKQLSSI